MEQLLQLAVWPITTVFSLVLYLTEFLLWLLAAFTHLTLLILGNSVAVLLKITSVTFEFGTVALPLLFQGVYTGGEWAVYVLVAAVEFLFSAVIATGELSWDVLFTVGDTVLNGSIVLGHLLAVVVTSVWFWVTTALFWAAAVVHSGVEFVVLLPWATVIGQTMSVILDCSTFIWTWFIYTPTYYLFYAIWIVVLLPFKHLETKFVLFEHFTVAKVQMEVDRLGELGEIYRVKEWIFVCLALSLLVFVSVLWYFISKKMMEKRRRQRLHWRQLHTARNIPVEIRTTPIPARVQPSSHSQIHQRRISVRVDGPQIPNAHTGRGRGGGRIPERKTSDWELEQKVRELSAELERQKEEGLCVVCLDARREVVLKPCNHYCTCQMCADSLVPKRCPMCRKRIQQVERIYHT